MKSLWFLGNSTECEQIQNLLASRGIPTYRSLSRSSPGVLFVCINEQFEDALAVLKNPEHEVAQPVDVEEFQRKTQTEGLGTVLWSSVALLVFLLCVVGVMWAVHASGYRGLNIRSSGPCGTKFRCNHALRPARQLSLGVGFLCFSWKCRAS